MANRRRNTHQKLFASTELTRIRKQARRRNAVPSTKQAQRELAAQAAAEHPVKRSPRRPAAESPRCTPAPPHTCTAGRA